MSADTDRMDAEAFARTMYVRAVVNADEKAKGMVQLIASRDAYRERKALEAAWERAQAKISANLRAGYSPDWDLRAAILGEPRFVKGQLVRGRSTGTLYVYKAEHMESINYEPVLDRDGKPVFLPVEEA